MPSDILIHAAIWPQHIRAENWGCVPLGRGGWVPIQHNVARAEAYLQAKFHLDRPTVWPQYTNVTDRQDRQTDNCLIA